MNRSFLHFVCDVAVFARWRLAPLGALTVLAALAEGGGLLLLVPVLQYLGIGGDQAPKWNGIGLEEALALYVVLVAAATVVVAARGVAVTALRYRFVDHLRRQLHYAVAHMEWRAFGQLAAADITHVITNECSRSAMGFDFLLRTSGWAVEIPVLLMVAFRLSPSLTCAALFLAILCFLLTRPLNAMTHRLGGQLGEAHRALQRDLTDNLNGMRVIRSFGIEAARCHVFSTRMSGIRDTQLTYQRMAGVARAIMQALAAGMAAVALWTAVRLFEVPMAETLVLMAAFARLLSAGLRVQDGWGQVLHALPGYEAVIDLLTRVRAAAEPVPPPDFAAPEPLVLHKAIRLEGVRFTHRDGAPSALTGISVEIPARRVTALVGPSGAGKSTLADLLLGLNPPDEGRILIDGAPLDGAKRRAWRRQVGYVPQDAFLFHDTIRANLAVAAPDAGEPALWDVLERAAAADFVRALPQGLDTVVGDRGTRLSGGERQRLALARALLVKPELLILDEPTSALDDDNESKVLAALQALRHTVTVVIAAHRESTIGFADNIVRLENGKLANE